MKPHRLILFAVLVASPAVAAAQPCTPGTPNCPLAPISNAATAPGLEFGELADSLLCERFKTLRTELQSFTDVYDDQPAPMLPHDQKYYGLRKDVANARFLLDVFVPAYPRTAGANAYRGEDDLYDEIREHLDVGYDLLGQFKDLWDAQRNDLVPGTRTRARRVSTRSPDFEPSLPVPTYDAAEVDALRARIYQWLWTFYGRNYAIKGMFGRTESRLRVAERNQLAAWESSLVWDLRDLPEPAGREPEARYRGYVDYICSPLETGPYDTNRSPRELPKYFWRILATNGVYPEPREEGIPALSRMSLALLQHAAAQKPDILGLTDLTVPDQEETFHDFRKLIRGVVNVFEADALAGVEDDVKAKTQDKIDADILDDIVDRFGSIEDLIVGYRRGRVTQAEISSAWQELRTHMETDVFVNTLTPAVVGP